MQTIKIQTTSENVPFATLYTFHGSFPQIRTQNVIMSIYGFIAFFPAHLAVIYVYPLRIYRIYTYMFPTSLFELRGAGPSSLPQKPKKIAT